MAAGVGRQSSAVINNRRFNCRVACVSFLFPTSPPWWVDAQGVSERQAAWPELMLAGYAMWCSGHLSEIWGGGIW